MRTTPSTHPSAAMIYELEMTLHESAPRIWRRLLVPGTTTVHRLHHILQALMLWEDYHLYEFTVDGVPYGIYEPEFADEQPVKNARQTRLADVAGPVGAAFTYLYDFGDSWQHDLVVRAIRQPDPRQHYPLCVAGERAGPPEDCGGIWAYTDLVALLERGPSEEVEGEDGDDGEDGDYDEMLTWLGGDFDPAGFDRNTVNRRLHRLR